MIIKYRLSDLKSQDARNPGKAFEFMLSRGKIDGDFVLLDEAAQDELKKKFPPTPSVLRYRIADLKVGAREQPPGYVDFILSRGKMDGDFVTLDAATLQELRQKYATTQQAAPLPGRVRFSLDQLKHAAEKRPPGYVNFLLTHGWNEGGFLVLDEPALQELNQQFPQQKTTVAASPPHPGFNLAQLRESAQRRPAGFVDFVLSHAKIEGDYAVLDAAAEKELKEKFPTPWLPPPPEPSWAEIAANFTGAMASWAKAGFKVVEREVFEKRHATCLACEHWDPHARAGLGKCKRCFCTRAKLWLATSSCPLKPPKWSRVDARGG
jgi:hypothetical protein